MKKIFITLLFAILSIGSSMADTEVKIVDEPKVVSQGNVKFEVKYVVTDKAVFEYGIIVRLYLYDNKDSVRYETEQSSELFNNGGIAANWIILNEYSDTITFTTEDLLKGEGVFYDEYLHTQRGGLWQDQFVDEANMTLNARYKYAITIEFGYNDTDINQRAWCVFEVTDNTEGIYDIFDSSAVQCTKIMRDSQIYIQRGDKVYTIQGREVK